MLQLLPVRAGAFHVLGRCSLNFAGQYKFHAAADVRRDACHHRALTRGWCQPHASARPKPRNHFSRRWETAVGGFARRLLSHPGNLIDIWHGGDTGMCFPISIAIVMPRLSCGFIQINIDSAQSTKTGWHNAGTTLARVKVVSTYFDGAPWKMVRLAGIEPTTLGFGGQYSIH